MACESPNLDFCSDERKVLATRRERGGEMSSVQAGVHLAVPDIEAAREELLTRGVEVSEVFHEGKLGARCSRRSPRACRAAEELPR
jgi:hypothetical protein